MGANSEVFPAIARKRASRSDRDATETDSFAETILRGRLKCACAGDSNSSVTVHPCHTAGSSRPFCTIASIWMCCIRNSGSSNRRQKQASPSGEAERHSTNADDETQRNMQWDVLHAELRPQAGKGSNGQRRAATRVAKRSDREAFDKQRMTMHGKDSVRGRSGTRPHARSLKRREAGGACEDARRIFDTRGEAAET